MIYNPIVVRILVSNKYQVWWRGTDPPPPPDPPPGSATALVPFDILSTAFGNSNTPIASYRCTVLNLKHNHYKQQIKQGKKLFFSLTSYKRYSPKLVLFHKCFSAQHGRISSLLPKCAGQNYVTWHALHDCTESWFACGSSTVVFVLPWRQVKLLQL